MIAESPFERLQRRGTVGSTLGSPQDARGRIAAIEKKMKRYPTDLTEAEGERISPCCRGRRIADAGPALICARI
jgi:hypothetical protein